MPRPTISVSIPALVSACITYYARSISWVRMYGLACNVICHLKTFGTGAPLRTAAALGRMPLVLLVVPGFPAACTICRQQPSCRACCGACAPLAPGLPDAMPPTTASSCPSQGTCCTGGTTTVRSDWAKPCCFAGMPQTSTANQILIIAPYRARGSGFSLSTKILHAQGCLL